jgi:hypothetical protein
VGNLYNGRLWVNGRTIQHNGLNVIDTTTVRILASLELAKFGEDGEEWDDEQMRPERREINLSSDEP